MDINKASEVGKVMNQINRCKSFLSSLDGHSYPDEYVIYYRECETCELEVPALNLLVDYYKKQLSDAENKLKSL